MTKKNTTKRCILFLPCPPRRKLNVMNPNAVLAQNTGSSQVSTAVSR